MSSDPMSTFMSTFSTSPKYNTVSNGKVGSRKKSGIKRQRLGCLTCRHRRKKCDHEYSICGHCMRLNLVCKWEKPRDLVPDSMQKQVGDVPASSMSIISPSSSSSVRPTGQYSALSFSMSRAPDTSRLGEFLTSNHGQDRRLMLTYYIQVLAGLLTTSHDNNSFLTVFLPMAMDSPLLQRSLVAWSSAHLSCYSKDHLIDFFGYRSSALSIMATTVSTQKSLITEAEVMLATCLVLCSMEITFGDTKDWYQHLLAAKNVIMSMNTTAPSGVLLRGPKCFARSRDGRWLLRNFAYHDILASLTSSEPLLIPGRYWLESKVSVVDSYMGYSSEILALLAQICTLDTIYNTLRIPGDDLDEVVDFDNFNTDNAFCTIQDFSEESGKLEKALKSWNCPGTSDSCLANLAESHRSTALIALYRKQRLYCRKEHKHDQQLLSVIELKISEEVERTLHYIKRIPIGSLPESGTLFPLFIAGGEAMHQADIDFVHLRLKALHQFQHFGNTARAIDVLVEFWMLRAARAQGSGSRNIDWMDVLKSKGWKLMLS